MVALVLPPSLSVCLCKVGLEGSCLLAWWALVLRGCHLLSHLWHLQAPHCPQGSWEVSSLLCHPQICLSPCSAGQPWMGVAWRVGFIQPGEAWPGMSTHILTAPLGLCVTAHTRGAASHTQAAVGGL